jgi:hypothetical protein
MGEALVRNLLRLVVSLAILAGVYFFIVSPIVGTTNDTFKQAFDANDDLQDQINDSFRSAGLSPVDLQDDPLKLGDVDLTAAIKHAPDKRTKKLLRCIDRTEGNVDEIVACQDKLTP